MTVNKSGSAIQAFSGKNAYENGMYDDIYGNYWSESKPDVNAKYPRWTIGSNTNNYLHSTCW